MTRMRRSFLASVAVVLLVGGGLTACTGDKSGSDGSPKPSGSASASASSSGQSAPVGELTEQYLAATAATPKALASVTGTIRDGSNREVPGTLDLLSVVAGPTSTSVRWRLSSEKTIEPVWTSYLNKEGRGAPDTSRVVLVAKQANLRLEAGVWKGTTPFSDECTCAWGPYKLGPAGVELSGLYPVLPSAVTEVELRAPGFPAVSASVTRG